MRSKREPPRSLNRRQFLQASAVGVSGLFISFALPSLRGIAASAEGGYGLTAWMRIAPDGKVTLMIPSTEMGQGVATSLSMLIAEELEVDWSDVRIEFPPANPAYTNPMFGVQGTGGSTSIRAFFLPLRQVGAVAREMLREAAATKWGVPIGECQAADGRVSHASGKSAGYGELVDAAAKLPVPTEVALRSRKDWRLIGKPTARLDTPAKVNGSAGFGVDVRVPDMLVGSVVICPVFGGKLKAVDDKPALAVKGVRAVVTMPDAVAVVGDGYWQAKKGLAALKPQWDEGSNTALDSAYVAAALRDGFGASGAIAEMRGEAGFAMERSTKKIEAVYSVPFLAHATLEPMNATAQVWSNGCEIWAPTQAQGQTQQDVARMLGLKPEQIKVNTTYVGGGFGRKFERDCIAQAVRVSKSLGKPVKLIWSREQDMQHDFYRPASTARLRAGLDNEGRVTAWEFKIVSPSILARLFPQAVRNGVDSTSVEGAINSPYAPANCRIEYVMKDFGVPVGFWRSVGNSINSFYIEGFVDELAHAAGQDPYAFRRNLLADKPRHKAVLERAATMAKWGQPLPAGHFHGIALHESFGSIVAEVVEISVDKDGLRLHRVDCAVDCGVAVNPSTIVAQTEGGVVYGLTAALFGEITLKRGRVEQTNFDTYQMLQLGQMPEIVVSLIEGADQPGGIGEPGTPPAGPALVNAIFAATGKRIRSLPVVKQGITVS
jgi:isoquinoline 1-oxidoreductase beta subunit